MRYELEDRPSMMHVQTANMMAAMQARMRDLLYFKVITSGSQSEL